MLVSRVVLPVVYKSFHNNHNIVYNEMVLKFFINTIAKPHVQSLTINLFYMRFCTGADKHFQHHFVINIDYCITETSIINCIPLKKYS